MEAHFRWAIEPKLVKLIARIHRNGREKQMKKSSKWVVSGNKPNREIKSIEPKHFGRGRPTKYKPEHVQFAKSLAKLGATDADLADMFQVRISTIRLWMNIYPEFSEAIRVGKDAANKRVERSLYERANGYNYDAVKIFMPAGSKQPIVVHYTEHCPRCWCRLYLVEEQRSRTLARRAERRACHGQVFDLR
jgi:hypothetical protein